jgi:NAD(P)-dependent dehydrogenase (short-subunit alcohol dehydrogenase family)
MGHRNLEGKIEMIQTILVTGCSSGFGRLTVETLARQKYIIFAGIRESAGRNKPAVDELRALAEKERLALYVVDLDVTDDVSVEQAVDYAVKTAGRLDVVINNAGDTAHGPLEGFTSAQMQALFDTNVFGVLRMGRAALPQMRAQGSGLLLQIGSISGCIAIPFMGLYSTTKIALARITETYRLELAPLGIDAAIIEPGFYPTNLDARRLLATGTEHIAPYAATMNMLFSHLFPKKDSSTPANPQDVVDAIVSLIALPAGKRPLHTVVTSSEVQYQIAHASNDMEVRAHQSGLAKIGLLPFVAFRDHDTN